MRWARGLVVGASVLVAACLLPELADLGGSGAQDASTAGDASFDAMVPDAKPNGDAAAPDAPSGDGAASVCPDASFCDDFDNGPLGGKWSGQTIVDGVLALETGGLSAPNLLRASLVTPTGSVRRAGLTKTYNVTTAPKRIVCAVSAKVVVRPTSSGQDLQLLEIYEQGSTFDDFFVKITSSGTYLHEEFTGADGGPSSVSKSLTTANGGIGIGTWTRLTLDVNFQTKAASLTILPSGGSASTISMTATTPATGVKSYDLNLAEPDDHDTDPSTIQYDDFRCDFTP